MKKITLTVAATLLATQLAFNQVVINEVSTNTDEKMVFGQTCDWIELYNPTPGMVYLHDYYISDKPDKPQKWRLSGNYKIEPNGFLIILCNQAASGANTNFKLSAEGETIVLSDANGTIVDKVEVPQLMPDQTYGRATDGSNTWTVFKDATPNATNNNSTGLTATPIMSINGGFFNSTQVVSLTCPDPDAIIYYTTDGSMPTSKSAIYSSQINIANTTVLRAVALNPSLKTSYAVTNTFFINLRKCDLPVVSLSTDNANFYDDNKGIYVQGKNGKEGNCANGPANWNQDWERPIHFEYFDKNHKQALSVDAGVKIFGHCSRTNAMKSLRIVARKLEYGEKKLEYKFFENKDIDKFKSIVLRDGGNDFQSTMIRDAMITQLCSKHMDVDIQELQPAAVFLNGQYLGLHNIREKISDHYVQENYGLEHERINLLENNAEVIEGNATDYKNLMQYVRQNSLKDNEIYENVKSQIDINNFIDYYIAQLYIDNEDWPNNNIKYWKTQGKNSRWRWILFGSEYSCGVYGGQPNVNSIKRVLVDHDTEMGNPAWSSELIKALLQNDEFKAIFLQRFAYHIEHTFDYNNVSTLCDSIKGLMLNEWQYHSAKWYPWLNQQNWSNNINNVKNWFKNRPDYIKQHLMSVFNISSTINLSVKCDNNDAKILLADYATSQNISGTYFADTELKLEAQIPLGYGFDHWIVVNKNNGQESNSQENTQYPLIIKPTNDIEVTLVLKKLEETEPEQRTVSAQGLKINEICTKNGGQVADEYNDYPAWIEIMNPTDKDIDLTGVFIGNGKDYYYVTSAESENTILAPGAKVLFFTDNHTEKGVFHTNFELNTDGGTIELVQMINNTTEMIDQVKYPKLSKNQSYGYATDCKGDFVTFAEATPYAANGGSIIEPVPFYVPENNIATPTENVKESTLALVIYPNPAKEYLTIKGCSDMPEWSIISLNGTTIKSGTGTSTNVSDLKSGYYLVRITDNGKTEVVKLLKI